MGVVLIKDGSCEKDIHCRFGKASPVFARLIWKNKHVSIQTKSKLYEVFVLSVFLYGTECWTLRKGEHRILTAEMGWLRKLVGVSRRQSKKNEDNRLGLNQMKTLIQNIQRQTAVVWACGADGYQQKH